MEKREHVENIFTAKLVGGCICSVLDDDGHKDVSHTGDGKGSIVRGDYYMMLSARKSFWSSLAAIVVHLFLLQVDRVQDKILV